MTWFRRGVAAAVVLLFPVFIVALFVALGWLAWWWDSQGRSGLFVIFFLIASLATAVVAGLKELRALRPEPAEGLELEPAAHPRLWHEVRRLADAVGATSPDRIVVVPEADAAVGSVGGSRELLIGLPLLAGLTTAEFRSMVAHELGHFAGGDTDDGEKYLLRAAAVDVMRARAGFPINLVLGLYAALTRWAAGPASRERERLADRHSLEVAGPAAVTALEKLPRLGMSWDLLDAYVGLFDLAGRRASLTEGLHEILRVNATYLDARVPEVLAEERRSLGATHPPLRQRIAAFRATLADRPPAGPVASEGDAPAVDLLEGGRAWLDAHEGRLLLADHPLAAWDEVAERGGLAMMELDSGTLDGHLRGAGAAPISASAALEKLAAGGVAAYEGIFFDHKVKARERGDAVRSGLETILTAALVDSGQARFALDWTGPTDDADDWGGPVRLVDASGMPLALVETIDRAVTEGDPGIVRDWLARNGLSLDAAPVARTTEFAERWLGAITNATGPWEDRRDVHLWSTGILALPLTEDEQREDKRDPSTERQEERVMTAAGPGAAAARETPEALWWPKEDLESSRLTGRLRFRVEVTPRPGGAAAGQPFTITASTASEFYPDLEPVVMGLKYLTALRPD